VLLCSEKGRFRYIPYKVTVRGGGRSSVYCRRLCFLVYDLLGRLEHSHVLTSISGQGSDQVHIRSVAFYYYRTHVTYFCFILAVVTIR
jgi:hypothetical protein